MMTLLLFSCTQKQNGWWHEGRIAVIANDEDWSAVQEPLKQIFEKEIRTPQAEQTYHLTHVTEKELDRYSHFYYILLTGTLESDGAAGKLLQGMLADSSVRTGVRSGDYYLFVKHNIYALNQIFVILVAENTEKLNQVIADHHEEIFKVFDDPIRERMKKEMFSGGYQKEIAEKTMSAYGWELHLQKEYFLAREFPFDQFIWFRRTVPERWIFVRWIEHGDTSLLNQKWVVEERNRIGRLYYSDDQIEPYYLSSERGEFLGRPALITRGLWGNEKKYAGGPFLNYTFYNQADQRVYMIDLAVYAPEYEKEPLLKRLDIIAHTFYTIYDQKEE